MNRTISILNLPIVFMAILYVWIGPALHPTAHAAPRFDARDIAVSRAGADEAQRLGWKSDGLDAVIDYVSRMSTDSFIISTAGVPVVTVGDPDIAYKLHSVRKAMLSALVGQHVGEGPNQIPLQATLEDLNIDDNPQPLTPLQKQATVVHLLKSLSGINHRAAASGGLTADIDRRLGKSENQPGTKWAYNNWDYNALTTIFEQRTGQNIAQAFGESIAKPTGMTGYTESSVRYISDPSVSQHRAAMFRMSANDLLRFGNLYLNGGKSGAKQIIPQSWVELIKTDYVETGIKGLRAGHGYLWWLPSVENTGLPAGTFFAWGLGNQTLFVVPAWNTVIIHQSDTTQFVKRWTDMMKQGVPGGEALEKVVVSCFNPQNAETEFCIEHRFTTSREFDGLISGIVGARR